MLDLLSIRDCQSMTFPGFQSRNSCAVGATGDGIASMESCRSLSAFVKFSSLAIVTFARCIDTSSRHACVVIWSCVVSQNNADPAGPLVALPPNRGSWYERNNSVLDNSASMLATSMQIIKIKDE